MTESRAYPGEVLETPSGGADVDLDVDQVARRGNRGTLPDDHHTETLP